MIHHSTPKQLKLRNSKSLLYSAVKNAECDDSATSFDGRAQEVFLSRNDSVILDDDPDFEGSIDSNSQPSGESEDEAVVDLDESLKSCRKIGKVLARKSLNLSLIEEKTEPSEFIDGAATSRARKLFELESSLDENLLNRTLSKVDYISEQHHLSAQGKPVQISEDSLSWRHCRSSASIVAGFSTAAGNAVSVTEESLTRAKRLLNSDSTEAIPGLTTASGKPVLISDQSLVKAKQLLNEKAKEEGNQDRSVKLSGFSTAAGDAVAISEESFLGDLSSGTGNVLPGLTTTSGRQVSFAERNADESPIHRQNSALPRLSTAAGKPVLISNQSLDKAKKLFHAEGSVKLSLAQPSQLRSSSAASKNVRNMATAPGIPASFAKPTTPIQQQNYELPGLSTAAGKPILISNRSLDIAKKLFHPEGIDKPNLCSSSVASKNVSPAMTTAAGRPVSFADPTADELPMHQQNTVLPGLSTAAGKPVLISNRSLDVAKKLFHAQGNDKPNQLLCSSSVVSKNVLPDMATASRRPVSLADPTATIHQQNSALLGLSTAAGKPVLISNRSLDLAKKLYRAEDSAKPKQLLCSSAALKNDLPDMTIASRRPVSYAERTADESAMHQQNTALPGLSTAAGKPLLISNRNLDIAKKLLHAEASVKTSLAQPNQLLCSSSVSSKNVLPNTTTAAGRPVSFADPTTDESPMHQQNTVLPGLSTAAGKPVLISNRSLDKAKKLLLTEGSIKTSLAQPNQLFCSSSVASKNGLFSSTTASERPLSFAEPTSDELPKHQALPGLSTAGGKSVFISNRSLDLSKKLFFGENDGSKLSGFSTAAGNAISFSDKSLTQAKQLLNSSVEESLGWTTASKSSVSTADYLEPKKKLENFGSSSPPALSTAVAKPVHMPDQNIDQAKKLLYAVNLSSASASGNSVAIPEGTNSDKFPCQDDTFEEILSEITDQMETSPTKPQLFNEFDEMGKFFDQNSKRKSDVDFSVTAKKIKRSSEDEMMIKSAKEKQKEMMANKDKNYVLKINKKTNRLKILGETIPVFTQEELTNYGVDDNVQNVTSSNAAEFKFILKKSEYQIEIDDILLVPDFNLIGPEEIRDAFLTCRGVDPSRLPPKWVENHYRWIVWKLSSYETKFPRYFAQKGLTPKNVLDQLKYRYYREIQRREKSCLRKILDGDEPPQKRFICCISSIKNVKFEKENPSFEITDGWYAMEALIDSEMVKLVRNGQVQVGTKLILSGAEKISDKLKIHTNSARRVKWYVKMGFCDPSPLAVGLGSILPLGGLVSMTTAVVARVYPTLHMSKDNEGKTVFRNDQMQFLEDAKNDQIRGEKAQDFYEKILRKVEEDFEPQINLKDVNLNRLKDIEDPETLYVILKETNDMSIFTEEQINLAKNFHTEFKERVSREAEFRVNKEISSSVPKKKVTKLKRIRLVDYFTGCSFLLTLWNLNEISELKEDKVLDFYNITSCGIRDKVIQLSSTKSTKIVPNNSLFNSKYGRKVTKLEEFSDVDFKPLFGEVDVLAIVVYVWKSEQPFGVTKVFLCDLSSNYLTIAFWTSLDKFGCKEILEEGCLVSGSDLQWRSGSRSGTIPCVYATETSFFSQNPKRENFKQEFQLYKQFDKKALHDFASEEKLKLLNLLKDSDGLKAELKSTPCHKRLQILSELSPLPPVSPVPLINKHPGVKKGFVSPFRLKN